MPARTLFCAAGIDASAAHGHHHDYVLLGLRAAAMGGTNRARTFREFFLLCNFPSI
jgi:hypothetical protein